MTCREAADLPGYKQAGTMVCICRPSRLPECFRCSMLASTRIHHRQAKNQLSYRRSKREYVYGIWMPKSSDSVQHAQPRIHYFRVFRCGKHFPTFGLGAFRLPGERKSRHGRERLAELRGHPVVFQRQLRAEEEERGPLVLDGRLGEISGELPRVRAEPFAVPDPR